MYSPELAESLHTRHSLLRRHADHYLHEISLGDKTITQVQKAICLFGAIILIVCFVVFMVDLATNQHFNKCEIGYVADPGYVLCKGPE